MIDKKVKVEGQGEERKGETYEPTADGFTKWCIDRKIQLPYLFLRDYCDIEIMRRKFDSFSDQSESIRIAQLDLISRFFDDIRRFLQDFDQGVTREQVRTPSDEMIWLKAYRSAFESGSKIVLSPIERLQFGRSIQRIFGTLTESPSPLKPEGAAQENRSRSKGGVGE